MKHRKRKQAQIVVTINKQTTLVAKEFLRTAIHSELILGQWGIEPGEIKLESLSSVQGPAKLIEVDFEQAEMRILAALQKCKQQFDKQGEDSEQRTLDNPGTRPRPAREEDQE